MNPKGMTEALCLSVQYASCNTRGVRPLQNPGAGGVLDACRRKEAERPDGASESEAGMPRNFPWVGTANDIGCGAWVHFEVFLLSSPRAFTGEVGDPDVSGFGDVGVTFFF